jgi:hypothetical protein
MGFLLSFGLLCLVTLLVTCVTRLSCTWWFLFINVGAIALLCFDIDNRQNTWMPNWSPTPNDSPTTNGFGTSTILNKQIQYPSIETLQDSKRAWNGVGDEADNHRWYVEEKIDGSQISFSVVGDEVKFYNKGNYISPGNKVFTRTMSLIKTITKLNPMLIYHGEAVCSKQHNIVKYERTPKYYFVLYDIYDLQENRLLSYDEKAMRADEAGFEVVPRLWQNTDPNMTPYQICTKLNSAIEAGEIKSILGGRPEGVVLKHHAYFTRGKRVSTKLKLVCDAHKESRGLKQNKEQQKPGDCIVNIGRSYATQARFHKAFQHLRDAGKLTMTLADILKIKEELDADLDRESQDEISKYLYGELSSQIKHESRAGVEDWYKNFIANMT